MNKTIVILGGGTAGWMSACLLHHYLAKDGFSIILIESPEIETIGVGEGSTPQLKRFFDTLGIAEETWMPQCHATYKNGIRFHQWATHDEFASYFHPFPSMPDRQTAAGFLINAQLKRQGHSVMAHPDRFFLSAYLAQHRQTPKTIEGFPIQISYGYHFDAALLGRFLRDHAKTMGVQHRQGKIQQVVSHANGDIAYLVDDSGTKIAGDLFVDCSGFRSVLLQSHLKVPFVSYQSNLFNDSAVAMPTDIKGPIETQTQSTAMKCGWRWDIPLTHRTGNGYVYSSAYLTADQAEIELRQALGLLDADVPVRHLRMKVGRVEQHWHRNCLAVGLSQGFIEPLEATALHLVQETLESFVHGYRAGQFTNQHQEAFNVRINQRFEGIRDYIVCHYKVNRRYDRPYWLDCQNNRQISSSLQQILSCWDSGQDLSVEIARQDIGHFYPPLSWHCLLAGYGRFSPKAPSSAPSHEVNLDEIQHFIRQCAKGFLTSEQVYAESSQ